MKILTIAILVVFSCHAFAKNKKESSAKFVPGELIVKLRSSNKAFFKSLEDQGITVKRPINLSYGTLYVLDIGKNKSLKSTIQLLKNDPNVVYSEPNYIYEMVRPIESSDIKKVVETEDLNVDGPNDPLFRTLWDFLIQELMSHRPL